MKRRRFGARRVGRGGRRGGRTVPGAVHLADATASESAGLEASRARVPRACVARREVTARAIGAACQSLAKLPKVFARSVSDVHLPFSCLVKMSTCEWTSSAEKRKTRKRDAVTKPRGCFPSSGTAKISARCTILPGRADPLGPKIPRFLGIFGGSGLESETRKKCFLYTLFFATASSDSSSRGRLLRPLLRALDRYRDIARAFRTGTSPPESVSPSRARFDGRPSTADPPPRRG
jgi:hypothetical protein